MRRPSSTYIELPPPEGLRPWLACTWAQTIGAGDAPFLQRVLPDGCADAVWMGDAAARVFGPATVPTVEALAAGTSLVGVRFRPGAVAAALHVSAIDLRDRQPPLEALGTRAVRELDRRVSEVAGAAAKLAAIEVALREWLATAPTPDSLVLAVAAAIERDLVGSVEQALRDTGVSERQLRRRFAAAVGYGPKVYQRVARVQRLRDSAQRRPSASLATLAAELGYSDQAHMTREVSALAGLSPALLVARAPLLQSASDPFDVRNLQDGFASAP